MPLLNANDLGKSFGARDLFEHVSFSVPHRARIGLVGPNGVGKTTLFRLILGEEEPSRGRVESARSLRTGYLAQEAIFESDHTLWEECLLPFADLTTMAQELARLEAQLGGGDPEVLAEYGRLQHEYDIRGGYTLELRIRQTLVGLGFTRHDEHRPWQQLSGGQRTRALLAKLLLSEPDLLLLDEPTNHLDIGAIEWLEDYLKNWKGAVVAISHDRYFLDQMADTIWEMTPRFHFYHGNYSAYLLQRSMNQERQADEYDTQQEFIRKEEDYIRRNIAGQNTRQAKGRLKRLERLKEEELVESVSRQKQMRMNLQAVERSGELVIRTKSLSVGYQDEGKPLSTVPDLVLRRTECAAVIGPNGAGKTTFLKTLLGQLPPLAGDAMLGSSLKVGYFAQTHERLHPSWSLMDEIQAMAPKWLPGEIRDYLAKFLFTGEDVFKPVGMLSGGERSRLALALLALEGANLLLLDEPTNHLDLPAQEVLQGLLSDYAGTILLVSHDRYLIDGLASQVWEVQPSDKVLRVFSGTYSEYKASRDAEKAQKIEERSAQKTSKPEKGTGGRSKNEQARREKQLKSLENEIAGLEAQLAGISRQLETPGVDPGDVQKLGHDYVRIEAEMETKLQEWESMQEG
jgi:ATP-binding cassette, subfamily F, member 3